MRAEPPRKTSFKVNYSQPSKSVVVVEVVVVVVVVLVVGVVVEVVVQAGH